MRHARTFTRMDIRGKHKEKVSDYRNNLPEEYKSLIEVAVDLLPGFGGNIDKTIEKLKELNPQVPHEAIQVVAEKAARELES